MKLSAILILIGLGLSLFLPVTAHISIPSANQMKSLVSLDVCNASSSFLSAHADIYGLFECPCDPAPLEVAKYNETEVESFAPSPFSLQIDQPPKI